MIESAARGAWRELEVRLRPYVARRVSASADIEDVLQETFVRLHRGISGLRDNERFGAWVYRIAERVIADYRRRCARQPASGVAADRPAPEPTLPTPDDADTGLEQDLTECVALFVARLPSPYREAIVLTELEGLSQAAAAQMLGLSSSGMKSRVQRGREKIRRMFEECCEVSLDRRGRVIGCEARPLQDVPEDCREAAACWSTRRSDAK